MRNTALLILACSLSAVAYADTYKWVDEKGATHYTDKPPPPNAKKVERKKLQESVIGTGTPYSVQQAAKNHPVTLYINDCGDPCASARALLNKRGVPFTEKNPQNPAGQAELSALAGGKAGIPFLRVGEAMVNGFEEGQWNAALDNAGYPATSIAPRQPTQPKAPAAAGDKPPEATRPTAAPEPPGAGVPSLAPPPAPAKPSEK